MTPIQAKYTQVREALEELDEMLSDCSTVAWLLDADTDTADLLDLLKSIASSVQVKLRNAAAAGPVFMPEGTLRLDEGPSRKMRPQGKALIRRRIIEAAKARSQGETDLALALAVELTEAAYSSPSDAPKWGSLKDLGMTWDDVADTEQKVKGTVFEPAKERP